MKRQPEDYVVFPLDVPTLDKAMHYVKLLRDRVGLFKVGLELFISIGPQIVNAIHDVAGKKVFLDLKLHDIPATVKRAFMAASRLEPRFITVHCDQGGDILRDVAEENPGGTKILAISVLTSLGSQDLDLLGFKSQFANDITSLVINKARIALDAGCQGLVCSGQEVETVRRELGSDMILATPGIRPAWTLVQEDDQKRIVTPEKAVRDGADYLVIGRPIRDAKDPAEAADRVAEEISRAL
jgi:orotidine-5'-phosphate decarboxylase